MVTTAPTTSRRPSDPADLLRADVDLMVRFAAEHGVTMPEGVAHSWPRPARHPPATSPSSRPSMRSCPA